MKPNKFAARAWRPRVGVLAAAVLFVFVAVAAGANDQLEFNGLTGKSNLSFYRGTHWGLARIGVANPSDEQGEARAILNFKPQRRLQFVRPLWLPAQSRREVMVPVRYAQASRGQDTVETQAILTPPGAERQLDRADGLTSFRFSPRSFATISGDEESSAAAAKVMKAVRGANNLSSAIAYIPPERAPRFTVGWEGMSAVGVMTADAAFDPAQRRALRAWLRDGGNLVVFLNRTPPAVMARLLGEEWGVSVVDRATLPSLTFEAAGDASAGRSSSEENTFPATVEVEQPLEMVRLIAPAYKTHLRVRGWPALMSRKVGRGKVVLVAVEGPAWTHAKASPALAMLSEQILGSGSGGAGGSEPASVAARVASGESGQRFVSGRIGYRVVSRPVVAAVLGGFLLVLVIAAGFWWREGHLERLGPVGAVVAVAAMAVLLAMGRRERQQVPPTRATLQLISSEPGQRTARLDGVMGLYDTSAKTVSLSGGEGGTAWPVETGGGGGLMRLVVRDLNQWTWKGLPLAGGSVQPIQFGATAALSRPLSMDLRFGPDGLSGSVDWPVEGGATDALLATPRANMSVRTSPGENATRIAISPGDILPPGGVYTSGLVSESRRERAAVLGDLLRDFHPDRPTLLAWSKGLTLGFKLDTPLEPDEQALWRVPLRIEDTEPGTRVSVPWPLVSMRPDRRASEALDLSMMPIYRSGRGWSQEVPTASAFVARFRIPEQVRPLEVDRATIHLDVTAIGRPVRVMAVRGGKAQRIETLQSPDGPQTLRVPPEMLEVDEAGDVTLAFDVGALTNQGGGVQSSNLWKVRRFGLSVRGTVRE